MRRAIAFVICASAACAFPDLSGLTGGDAGSDVANDAPPFDANVPDVAPADVVVADVPIDAPVWQRSAGDVDVFFASVTGAVSTRTWSSSSKTWSAAAPVASFSSEIVPHLDVAASATAEDLALSSWSGSSSGNASFHLLEAASFAPKLSAASVIPGGQAPHRTFDVAFEHTSGDALAVFANGTSAPQFATRTSGTWSSVAAVAQNGLGAPVDWVELVTSPLTDEITLLFTDTAHALYATTWSGQAWMSQTPTKLDAGALNVSDFPAFAGAYGNSAGNLLVMWAHASTCSGAADPLYYATKAKGSNSFGTSAQTANAVGSPGPIAMASEPGTNRIAISILEWCSTPSIRQNGQNDFSVAMWDGSTFVQITDIDSTPAVDYTNRLGASPIGVAWASPGTAIAVYEAASTIAWAKWSGTSWTLQSAAVQSPALPVASGFQLLRLLSGDVMLLIEDVNQSLWAKRWNGSAFSDMNNGASLADGLYIDNGRPFAGVVVP
jgi:hypothetical protein